MGPLLTGGGGGGQANEITFPYPKDSCNLAEWTFRSG